MRLGVLFAEEAKDKFRAIKTAIIDLGKDQSELAKDSASEARFIEYIQAAITNGTAKLFPREKPLETIGSCAGIGWFDDDGIYLSPTAAYTVAQQVARDLGEPELQSLTAIFAHMVDRKWVSAATEKNKTGLKVSNIGGGRVRVLDFKREMFDGLSLPMEDDNLSVEEVHQSGATILRLVPSDPIQEEVFTPSEEAIAQVVSDHQIPRLSGEDRV